MKDATNVRPGTGGLEPLAVGMSELPGLLRISRRSLERERSAGRFPKPDRMIGKRPLWSVTTVRKWMERGGS
jgi:predicted DNA-binding transcriptional regulator AlpA